MCANPPLYNVDCHSIVVCSPFPALLPSPASSCARLMMPSNFYQYCALMAGPCFTRLIPNFCWNLLAPGCQIDFINVTTCWHIVVCQYLLWLLWRFQSMGYYTVSLQFLCSSHLHGRHLMPPHGIGFVCLQFAAKRLLICVDVNQFGSEGGQDTIVVT